MLRRTAETIFSNHKNSKTLHPWLRFRINVAFLATDMALDTFRLSGRRLAYFLAVIDCGSVRGAAEMLDMDASAVSRAIAGLEEELGATLLRRQGRGVAVTDIGELVAAHARRQSAHEQQLQEHIRRIQAAASGHVEMVIGEGFMNWITQGSLVDFLAERPGVTVNLTVESTQEIAARIIGEQADIGVIYQPPESQWLRIHQETLHPHLVVFIHRDHPLARYESGIRLRDLAAYRGVLLQDQLGMRQTLRRAEVSEGVTLPAVVTTNSFSAAFNFARRGVGYAVTAVGAALPFSDEMTALPLLNKSQTASRSCVVTRHGRVLSPAANALLSLLVRDMARDFGPTAG